MDKYAFTSRLTRLEEDISKLAGTISAMKITKIDTYGKNYEALSIDAATCAERLACSLRNLIFSADLVSRPLLMENVSLIHGISIHHAPGIVEITLPGLMPKRTKRVNTTFLTDPLYACLEQYSRLHALPHFKECVVSFNHVFDRSLSTKRIRDYDNLECKQLLDTVSGFLLLDDGGLFCDVYHTTSLGYSDYTVLTVMEKETFPNWLSEQKNTQELMSDFS